MRRLLAAALAVALLACVATAEEVARGGDLLPYESAEVVRLELLGLVTVYVEVEQAGGGDLLNAGLLALVAAVAAVGWSRVRGERGPARVLGGFALVAGALALDEALALHETAGHNLRFLAGLPGIERPDDAIVVFGAVLLTAAGLACLRTVARVRLALALFALAGLAGLAAALGDPLGFAYEEQLEVAASALALGGTALLVRGLLLESSSASTASSSAGSASMSSLRANSAGERRSSGRSDRPRVSGEGPPLQRM